MMNKRFISSVLLSLIALVPASQASQADQQSQVITAQNVDWGYLNPLRGDKSPGAADLWGSRLKNTATGMLVRFNPGFSSPPHVHNISYRGVVIQGLMHNADPNAEHMWMPKGSFWTQPAGHNHITAANSLFNMIYLEIDAGPYLVKPSSEHFDNGARPINVHRDNLVWLDLSTSQKVKGTDGQIAYLWGGVKSGQLGGVFIKLPTKFDGELFSKSDEFKAVVISGAIEYQSVESPKDQTLEAGSFFRSTGEFGHRLKTSNETIIYLRTDGGFQLTQKK